ncbi:8380_t:CDS:2, partial [Funneliformis geosporum]
MSASDFVVKSTSPYGITYFGSNYNFFKYKGKRKGLDGNENFVIRTNFPIPAQCELFYFEVDIIDKGENGKIGIGFCTKSARLNELPGCEDSSWGYRGDDGNTYLNNDDKSYGPKFMTGDTIGCSLNIRNNTVYYTRNGVNL